MVSYRITYQEPHRHILHISCFFDGLEGPTSVVKMPMWRPGRYEFQQFPKNILSFEVFGFDGTPIPFKKNKLNAWELFHGMETEVEVRIKYVTTEINAGSSYIDEGFFYVNPCNCLVYMDETRWQPCTLKLEVPEGFQTACPLPNTKLTIFQASDFDELADSPFVSSPNLDIHSFDLAGKKVRIVLWGKHPFKASDWVSDFEKFCKEQVDFFGEFPCPSYDFLCFFPYQRIRHGVEHANNTVCVIGGIQDAPSEVIYKDMLALASHEFFHLWNVKRIRPSAMLPYNYETENLSTLGWVFEGATTYYGDLMCLRAGVFSFDTWAQSFGSDVQKHFDNFGRYRYSVAESGYDTWLDGYVPGVPGRKVSIYTEGMLACIILDCHIREKTRGKKSLDNLFKLLFNNFYKQGLGYDEEIIKAQLEDITGEDPEWFFDDLIWGKGNVERYLPKTLQKLGLEMEMTVSETRPWEKFGLRLGNIVGGMLHVLQIHPHAPWLQDIDKDWDIEAINGVAISDISNIWAADSSFWQAESVNIRFRKGEKAKELTQMANLKHAWKETSIKKISEISEQQRTFYENWSGQKF